MIVTVLCVHCGRPLTYDDERVGVIRRRCVWCKRVVIVTFEQPILARLLDYSRVPPTEGEMAVA